MSFLFQWFYIFLGIYLTYETARWPGFEHYIAAAALFVFALAFRADMKQVRRS